MNRTVAPAMLVLVSSAVVLKNCAVLELRTVRMNAPCKLAAEPVIVTAATTIA